MNYALISLLNLIFEILIFLIFVDVIGSWIRALRVQLPDAFYRLLDLLLPPSGDGRLPGATLRAPRSVRVTARLLGSTPVARVEVVQNGLIVASAPPPPSGAEELIATVRFDEPGWLLVRAIGADRATLRMATTAPWRLSVSGKPARVSRRAVAFFAEWVEERAAQLLAPSAPTRASAAVYVEEARRFWRDMALRANAD